jgi:hypothetical protein
MTTAVLKSISNIAFTIIIINFWFFYPVGINLIVRLRMSMIDNDDVGLEVAAVLEIEVNSSVRRD